MTTDIFLTGLVVVCLAALWYAAATCRKQAKIIKHLKMQASTSDCQVDLLRRLCYSEKGHRYSVAHDTTGCASVLKTKFGNSCIIKVFTDGDAEFNDREAQDLLEKLNEK